MVHQPFQRKMSSLVLFLFLTGGGFPAVAQECDRGDTRSTSYMQRPGMRRCEGSRSRQIAAQQLGLASFTIGQAREESDPNGGGSYVLEVPSLTRDGNKPEVEVQARKDNYHLIPLEFLTRRSWLRFQWGAAVIRKSRIDQSQLQATAKLRRSGQADLYLPVRFTPEKGYTLVLESTGPLQLTTFRIENTNGKVVKDFTAKGPLRIDQELRRKWNPENLPAGTYRLIVEASDANATVVNLALHHDPRWLTP
ncbi:MAG: hypothetical protein ACK587_17075 [Cyanobacteriota bacterium]